ncbi:beta-carotene ketolase CrtW [Gloeothece verrucosa]|uniref:Fatty acid desaturase n=1 Tax=Gloeothece verrucosa (strain PCC 7822) TaxID=497965 RepID=E0UJH1_GLOV7|nr:fatty acid desaturase [Gloeothece verrucosa PCC 7822]
MNNCNYSILIDVNNQQKSSPKNIIMGLIIAVVIIGLWLVSLAVLLCINTEIYPLWLILIAIFWQMFLFTGLFITAHDAIHGSVFAQNKKINHWIGSLAVFLYCFLSYPELVKKHWLHHHHPASELDPDYHDGKRTNGILWYLYFMKRYWTWNQFIGMTIVLYLSKFLFHISSINFCLFWIIPLVLSSMQLFYFGTFLPHREPEDGYVHPHCAQSLALPVFLSFLTCYHFGYHQEHHEYPHVPWWQLPKVYQQKVLRYCDP